MNEDSERGKWKALDSHTVAGIKLDASSKKQQQEVPPC